MSNQLNTQARRLFWVDYAKGIAIILVVYRHILIGIERSGIEVSVWLRNANEMVYSFRMPLFFILSGIFISRTISREYVHKVKVKDNPLPIPDLGRNSNNHSNSIIELHKLTT
jgi:fucose 4-O-acetylase-like acetyltransferase